MVGFTRGDACLISGVWYGEGSGGGERGSEEGGGGFTKLVFRDKQGGPKRCRLSWLTNNALVLRALLRGWGLRSLSQ
jgi:hypothetical protein